MRVKRNFRSLQHGEYMMTQESLNSNIEFIMCDKENGSFATIIFKPSECYYANITNRLLAQAGYTKVSEYVEA